MGVRVVSETDHEDERVHRLIQSVEQTHPPRDDDPKPPKPGPNHRLVLIEIMGTVAKLLGIRMQLFFAFLGAFVLGSYAVYRADATSLVAFGMYAVLVFLPILFVVHRKG